MGWMDPPGDPRDRERKFFGRRLPETSRSAAAELAMVLATAAWPQSAASDDGSKSNLRTALSIQPQASYIRPIQAKLLSVISESMKRGENLVHHVGKRLNSQPPGRLPREVTGLACTTKLSNQRTLGEVTEWNRLMV